MTSSDTTEIPQLTGRIRQLINGTADFDDVACEVFAFQYAANFHYRQWCGPQARNIDSWRQIPVIPVAAFRRWDLRSFAASQTTTTFLTSGTTSSERGRHYFSDLALYKVASLAGFRAAFGLTGRRRIISLIDDAKTAPDSSLSQMVSWVLEQFGDANSRVDTTGAALESSEPALILGTSFGLANHLESKPDLTLPPQTSIMETGGFKGRRRELTRPQLHALYRRAGVDLRRVIGEYGMTELSSQWYDGDNGLASGPAESRVYRSPPWGRVRVLDPVTMSDVSVGETGLIALIDPVNFGSVQAILTADLGVRAPDEDGRTGFIYRGRATGAAIRGCSLRDE